MRDRPRVACRGVDKLTRGGASRDLWRVVGPVPAQPAARARGRVVWRVVRAAPPGRGTRRLFGCRTVGGHTPYPDPAATDRRQRRALHRDHAFGAGRRRRLSLLDGAPAARLRGESANTPSATDRLHPAPRAPANKRDRELRVGRLCRERRQPSADRLGARRVGLGQRRLRGTAPKLGTAPNCAGTPLRIDLPRGIGQGWAFRVGTAFVAAWHRAAARFTPTGGRQARTDARETATN
jgi:hypothetical protein